MANTWGELSWNAGLWGEQSNAIATPTGFELNTSQGQANYTPVDGWGRFDWGSRSWGVNFANQQIESGSFPLTLSQGNVSIDFEINEGWGRLTWGENAWGGTGDVIVEGLQLNTSLNSVGFSITAEVPVTGQQLNTSLNSVTAFGLAEVFPAGQQLNISEGEVDVSPDALVTGQQLNITLGSPLSYNNEGWGRYLWGEEVWGGNGLWVFVNVDNTNLGLTINSGIREYWGQDAWGASTTEWGGTYVTETDISVTVEVSSIAMTISEGEVDPGPDANVTGIGMTVALAVGTVIAGDANTLVTGEQINIAQGTVEAIPNTIASVTGIGLNIAVGTVFAGGTSVIIPSGIGLTIALNSINNQIWTEINTGTDATWIEIDTAA
jgi:hypothetical protein